jgi:hypothetical protein
MPRRPTARKKPKKPGKSRGRRLRVPFWPNAARRRRWWRAFRRASGPAQVIAALVICAFVWLAANWVYQVSRKPTELFFPVSGVLFKSPPETWQQYARLFRKYSTPTMSAELLAAIAQVEGSGNPIARTYWRFAWGSPLFEMYRPASSAVGMYQLTDGTFAEARRYCIHDHAVVEDGPWDDWRSCWFNSLYARVLPGDAIELTSAFLDRHIAATLERHHLHGATIAQKHNLAALIHLCGAGAGDEYARRGLRLLDGQRCGDHLASGYVERVRTMESEFVRLAARDSN